MRCEHARELVSRAERGLMLRLHVLRCPECRAEAARVHTLDTALRELPRHLPPPDLLPKVLAVADSPAVPTQTKESHTMRRLIFAVGAMAVLAALAIVVVPGRHGKKDARTILSEVAMAMENVTSIRLSNRVFENGVAQPARSDMWFSPQQKSARLLHEELGVIRASSIRADAEEWWDYEREANTVYRADLKPYAAATEDGLARIARFFTSAGIKDMLQQNWKHVKQSVAYEPRDGHEIAVLTFLWERDLPAMGGRPATHVTDRQVYEVDTTADKLVATRRYFRYPDGKEIQIEETDHFEYNPPMPTEAELLPGVKGAKTAPAAVTVKAGEAGDPSRYLVFTVDGKPLNEGSVLTTLEFREKGE